MKHLTAEELLLAADQELTGERRLHLSGCLHCRGRLAELRNCESLAQELRLPLVGRQSRPPFATAQIAALLLCVVGIAGMAIFLQQSPERREETQARPLVRLTPGAVQRIEAMQFCSDRERQIAIPLLEAQAVFASYGIAKPSPGSYEVDFLIPPALGGSLDRQNLWPQPYQAGIWNSRVKDALEDHLVSLVCEGRLDLATAQRAMAEDWIASYKSYFGVSRPLPDHFAFVKDPAWR